MFYKKEVAKRNAARRAVKNFDALDIDTKRRILRWVQTAEGHNISKDVISGISNIMRIRGDLQVLLAEVGEGKGGLHEKNVVPGRNLIVLPSNRDVDILRETIAHELGHEVEGVEGFDKIKKAALKATKAEDIKEWENLYEGYPDADTEVAMKALGRRLATPKFIERYAENRSILSRIVDAGRDFINYLRADEAGKLEIDTTEKLIKMMNEALINGNVQESTKDARKRHLFIGTKADTADKMKLSTAQDMIANGADPEQVRKDTGWFRGYDGEWRFEIDDFDSSLVENPNLTRHEDDGEVYFTGKLTDIFNHPELYKAYPQLKDINIVIQNTNFGVDAIYQPNSNYITLSREHFKRYTKEYYDYLNGGRKTEIEQIEQTPEFLEYNKWYDDEIADNMDATEWLKGELEARQKFFSSELGKRYHQLKYSKDGFAGEKFELGWGKEAKAVILHELQHAVQNIEGFATGTNTRDADYDRNAGEIEAFDTGRRTDLTAEQRKNTRPDIDRADVVVKNAIIVSYMSANEYDAEVANIRSQIENSKDQLNKMSIVFSAKVPEYFSSKNAAKKWASAELKQYGYQADRQGLGVIEFNPSEINAAIEHIKRGEEIAAIVAVYRVLKRGIQIGEHDNHKTRGKHTITIAAPIELNGTRGNMGVVVNMKNKKYYIHRVVLPDGSVFKFDKKIDASREMHKGVPNGSLADATKLTSNTSIAQKSEKSTPSAKKSYNLTENTADQAAREAAEPAQRSEVDQYLVDEVMNARAAEADATERAERAEREAAKADAVHLPFEGLLNPRSRQRLQ